MEDIALWGNAAAVPIIIAITQFLKNNFPKRFKRRADVISLLVSVAVCMGWWVYTTPEAEIIARYQSGIISTVKGGIDLLIVSFATWLSATKSYDFFLGEKKRAKELDDHLIEKEKLRVELEAVRNDGKEPTNNGAVGTFTEDVEFSEKLRAILEERD